MFKTTLFDKGEYAARAREIHVLIGVFTIAQVIVWTTHYAASADMQRLFLQTFSAALISSGVVQMGSGLYLLSAMFFWLKPSNTTVPLLEGSIAGRKCLCMSGKVVPSPIGVARRKGLMPSVCIGF